MLSIRRFPGTVPTVEEFSTSLVDRINVRWRASKEIDRDLQRTPLKLIPNRAEQRKIRRKQNELLRQKVEGSRQPRTQSGD